MPQRIITDSRGQRWDVSQPRDAREAVFRHQSGTEYRSELDGSMDAMSTDDLLSALDRAREREGQDGVGHGGLDVALDQDGYETGR